MYFKDKDYIVSVRLNLLDLNRLDLISKKLNKSKSELIRFILKSYLISMERIFNENK